MYYNAANSYLFVNGKEIHEFIAKDSKNTPCELCLGNILRNWLIDNMKKASLKDYVCNFSVNYDAISVSDIHKYLMEKTEIL